MTTFLRVPRSPVAGLFSFFVNAEKNRCDIPGKSGPWDHSSGREVPGPFGSPPETSRRTGISGFLSVMMERKVGSA